MTIRELFPKDKYPLRARTEICLPDSDLTLYEERYYKNPITHISKQDSGVFVIVLRKAIVVFSYACLLFANSTKKGYLVDKGLLTEISKSQLDGLQEECWGIENSCRIVHLLVNAQWEQF